MKLKDYAKLIEGRDVRIIQVDIINWITHMKDTALMHRIQSGKSLIGIVDKESDGGLFLRLGPAVLAKGAICAINEIGFMSPEDQGHITDIAEEGRTTLTKYATHFELDAPTTIISTANPYNAEWNSVSNISKDEIPILGSLIDRNDQLYAFRDAHSEQELIEYTSQKTKIRKRRLHNYNFLRKSC